MARDDVPPMWPVVLSCGVNTTEVSWLETLEWAVLERDSL